MIPNTNISSIRPSVNQQKIDSTVMPQDEVYKPTHIKQRLLMPCHHCITTVIRCFPVMSLHYTLSGSRIQTPQHTHTIFLQM